MWTSSRTTSGARRAIIADRLLDRARLADDVDQPLELGAHAGAEERVVVDDDDAAAWRSFARSSPIASSTSVPDAGPERIVARAAVALHPADDRLAHAAAVGGHRGRVEAGAAVAHEHLERAPGSTSA